MRGLLRRLTWKRLVFAGAVLILGGFLFAAWASHHISARFEEREQDRSTRLLGRAYPLSPGRLGSPDDLMRRLDRLGYRRVRSDPDAPGLYSGRGGSVGVHLRGFQDPDGPRPSQVVRVRFDGGRITSVAPAPALLEPETLAVFHGPHIEERDPVDLADCPKHLLDAILAVEDRRFFLHPGIDPAGVARAIWADVISGSLAQGGSTLTQQLAKNLFFSGDRTFSRKAAEAFTAVVLEARYSKERILRAYINEVYLGQRGSASILGVGRAARHYFGKNVADLTLAESALLAGLIRAPGLYNPFLRPERARERRDAVLRAMQETGAVTESARREAEHRPLGVRRPRAAPGAPEPGAPLAAHASDLLRQDLKARYGTELHALGLKIHSSLDPVHQQEAERAVAEGLRALERRYGSLRRRRGQPPVQASLIAVDLRDGGILAMVGGRDFGASQFNRATQARRQPGSLFKPIVYLAGLTHPGDPGRRYREDDEDEGDEGGWRERMRRRRSRSEELVLAPGGALLPPFGEVVAASWTAGGARPPAGAVVPAARGERDPRGGRRWWWQREEDEEEPEEPEADANEPPPMPLTAATVLMDEPYEVVAGGKLWSPRNDDDAFRGPVTVQRAIEDSLNVPTARAAAAIGLDRIVETGRALGIASPLPAVPSLALGSAEVTPAEMAGAFATIAAEGRLTRPHLLRGVERPSGPGASGRILPAGSVPGLAGRTDGEGAGRQAVPREAALVMTALLEGVLDHGTGYSARSLGFEGVAAGKTGTSDGGRDLWFCGYTPDVLALVWVGYDEPAPTRLSGSMAALPIWVDFMRSIGADTRAPFEGDEELAWAAIDPATGGLARIACPETRWAPFVPGTEPTEECREHGSIWRRLFGRD